MSEHVITTLTLFQQENVEAKYKTTKKVDVVLTKDLKGVERVQCAHWSKGPRGGYTSSMSIGFSMQEFDEIYAAITILNTGLMNGTYAAVLNIDKPWDSVIRCTKCNETMSVTHMMFHRQSPLHIKRCA